MKYLKTLGLAILAMTAFSAFAMSASATTLTSPAGTTLGAGTKIKASAESMLQTDGNVEISCEGFSFEGETENAGGASETVRIPITTLFFGVCGGGHTLSVFKRGSLEIHTDAESADGNGVVTWSGGEIFAGLHRTILGFPITLQCTFYSENTTLGTITGSKNSAGKTATLDFTGAVLPMKEGSSPACGESFTWTGSSAFGTPDYLDID